MCCVAEVGWVKANSCFVMFRDTAACVWSLKCRAGAQGCLAPKEANPPRTPQEACRVGEHETEIGMRLQRHVSTISGWARITTRRFRRGRWRVTGWSCAGMRGRRYNLLGRPESRARSSLVYKNTCTHVLVRSTRTHADMCSLARARNVSVKVN